MFICKHAGSISLTHRPKIPRVALQKHPRTTVRGWVRSGLYKMMDEQQFLVGLMFFTHTNTHTRTNSGTRVPTLVLFLQFRCSYKISTYRRISLDYNVLQRCLGVRKAVLSSPVYPLWNDLNRRMVFVRYVRSTWICASLQKGAPYVL